MSLIKIDDLTTYLNNLGVSGHGERRIQDLPMDVNHIIVSFLVGERKIRRDICDAIDVVHITTETHNYIFNGAFERQVLPFDLDLYLPSCVDIADVDEVDSHVFYNARVIRDTLNFKSLFLFWLMTSVPTVQAGFDVQAEVSLPFWVICLLVSLSVVCFSQRDFIVLMFKNLMVMIWSLIKCLFNFILQFTGFNSIKRCYNEWSYNRRVAKEFKESVVDPSLIGKLESEDTELAYMLEQKKTFDGIEYKILLNGRIHKCIPYKSTEQLEMSQKNSILVNSEQKPVGIILATDGNKYSVIGGFFRIDNYLVTALHVAEVITSRANDFVYASLMKNDNNTCCVFKGYHKLIKDDFELESNVITFPEVDCHAVEKSEEFWSVMGISKPKLAHTYYDQTVTAVGIRNDILVCSTGLTEKHPTVWRLKHKATTHPGFSGFPLFQGKGIVGMHIGSLSDTNEFVRIETITALLPKKETPTIVEDEYYQGSRGFTGALQDYEDYFGYQIYFDRSGRVTFKRGYKKVVLPVTAAQLNEDPDYLYDVPLDVDDYFDRHATYECSMKPIRKTNEQIDMLKDPYDDESCSIPIPIPSKPGNKPGGKSFRNSKKKKVKESMDPISILPSSGVVHLEPLERMSVPNIKEPNPMMTDLLLSKKTELRILGACEGTYEWPRLDVLSEKVSLEKHLELYHSRVEAVPEEKRGPNPKVRSILYKMLSNLGFKAPSNFDDLESLEEILNSNLIKDHKSSGYPYAAQGMANNQTTLARCGLAKGFANIVYSLWHKPLILRVFNKGEPHKLSKIKDKMLRIIAGFPLHKTVKHISLFRNFKETVVKEWIDSPIKFPYSPLVPNASNHLKMVLGNGKLWSSDKKNWDFNMYSRYYQYTSELIQDLAQRPEGMSEEEFGEYKAEVDYAVREVAQASYVTSDGSHYKSKHPGIMRSGWYLTIIANSIAQLAIHIETCLVLGMKSEEIVKTVIIVGGDDVIQRALPCGKDKYIEAAKSIGIAIEIEETPSFEGSEFFSHRFYTEGRYVLAKPTRFPKHVENLKRTCLEEESGSIINYMREWVGDKKIYNFFHDLYMELNTAQPDKFPITHLPNRDRLLAELNGDEAGGQVVKSIKDGKLRRSVLERW